jgi:hypothetical protein
MSAGSPISFATGLNSISVKSGLSADELELYDASTNQGLIAFYKNALSNQSQLTSWESFYKCLHTVNSVLEGLEKSATLTPAVKQQLMGEAKFLRAFIHFYLVNLYGDVPLVTSSDYRVNALSKRTSQTQVYQQIIADLQDAQNLLSENYVGGDAMSSTTERVRPTKWAATALLARAYLYTGDWKGAEAKASVLISNTTLFDIAELNGIFMKNSKEAIWQLQPVNAGWNTEDARVFILTGGPNNGFNPVYLSPLILNAFEVGDQRLTAWVGSNIADGNTYFYSNKYKSAAVGSPVTEYLMVLRLAEQYLIRAEARAQQNNISGAQADINTIRQRAGLSNTTAVTKPDLLTAILYERQVELFTEWGHRWLDLKRTGTVDSVMSVVTLQKGGSWATTAQLYPLPATDLELNPNLVQNAGY